MKHTGKKLIISVLVLAVALSLAITSTYAWFSISATPKVEGFDVKVVTNDGLRVSLTGEFGSFKNNITVDDLMEMDILKDKIMNAVTSSDGKAFKTREAADALEENYISFDLYFYSPTAMSVMLKNSEYSFVSSVPSEGIGDPEEEGYIPPVPDVMAWDDFAADVYGQAITDGEPIAANAKDAARISFVNYTGAGTALPTAWTTPGAAVVWYPNPNTGFNKDVAGTTADESKNLARDFIVYQEELASLAVPNYLKTLSSANVHEGTTIINDKLLDLVLYEEDGGYYGKIKINIWLEGWDGDCFDSIFDDTLTVSLQFEKYVAVPVEPEP